MMLLLIVVVAEYVSRVHGVTYVSISEGAVASALMENDDDDGL